MRLAGLIAAVHSPFDDSGELQLSAVERQAQLMVSQGVAGVFICGSTGESHSLSVGERQDLSERWLQVLRGGSVMPIVHVGSNCLRDSRQLAAHAEKIGAVAIAAQAPSYFRPRSVAELCDWCEQVAAAAPGTPFYFYDIPVMTGVNLSMPDLLQRAGERISNFRGLKFTNQDLMSFQICQRFDGGRFDIAFGVDEMLLAAACLGATGAVGSSYNFAAPIYLRLLAALQQGALDQAREEQYRSVQLIRLLASFGYMGAARTVMG
ncbi:MAG: dihydrodipicolinate synthase family protein, partial [Planctomyces sp.]